MEEAGLISPSETVKEDASKIGLCPTSKRLKNKAIPARCLSPIGGPFYKHVG